jgi:hypothetical protein
MQMDMLYAPVYFRLLMRHLPLDKKFADAHCVAMMQILAPPDHEAAPAPARRRKSA